MVMNLKSQKKSSVFVFQEPFGNSMHRKKNDKIRHTIMKHATSNMKSGQPTDYFLNKQDIGTEIKSDIKKYSKKKKR